MSLSSSRTRGSVLVLVLLFAVMATGFAVVAVEATLRGSQVAVTIVAQLQAETAAISKLNWALAKVRRGGITTYDEVARPYGQATMTDLDVSTTGKQVTILSRGVVGSGARAIVYNAKVVVVTFRFIPNGPLYFGNGAVEWPRGNVEGHAVSSFISNAMNFTISAWNHPYDFLESPIATPPESDPRWYNQDPGSPFFGQAFSVFESQCPSGRQNISDWLAPWTSGWTTYDPMTRVEHLTSSDYDAFPTHTYAPDVQTFAYDLWANPRPADLQLSVADVQNGSYGNLGEDSDGDGIDDGDPSNASGLGTIANPRVVFMTGRFENSTKPFKGAGILVIRDSWDPAVGGYRNVSTKAELRFKDDFEWTGMIIVAGWAPNIDTRYLPVGKHVRVNGCVMGEDSVQSGGETSLENATIQLWLGSAIDSFSERGELDIDYSREVFSELRADGSANPMFQLMPEVDKRLTEMQTTPGPVTSWLLPDTWATP